VIEVLITKLKKLADNFLDWCIPAQGTSRVSVGMRIGLKGHTQRIMNLKKKKIKRKK
jgi:hypothetical protein